VTQGGNRKLNCVSSEKIFATYEKIMFFHIPNFILKRVWFYMPMVTSIFCYLGQHMFLLLRESGAYFCYRSPQTPIIQICHCRIQDFSRIAWERFAVTTVYEAWNWNVKINRWEQTVTCDNVKHICCNVSDSILYQQ
jgi:hypothetical protein